MFVGLCWCAFPIVFGDMFNGFSIKQTANKAIGKRLLDNVNNDSGFQLFVHFSTICSLFPLAFPRLLMQFLRGYNLYSLPRNIKTDKTKTKHNDVDDVAVDSDSLGAIVKASRPNGSCLSVSGRPSAQSFKLHSHFSQSLTQLISLTLTVTHTRTRTRVFFSEFGRVWATT